MCKKKKFSKLIKIVFSVLLLFTIISFITTTVENIEVNLQIEEFKKRAIFESEIVFINETGLEETRRYYKVERLHDYELNDTRSVFYESNLENREYLGQKGDIFVTQQSPFPTNFLIHPIMTYYFGGHAAINDGTNRFIEATGFPEPGESILDIIAYQGDANHNFSVGVNQSQKNYWIYQGFRSETHKDFPSYGNYYRKEFIGLRVKNVTNDQIDNAVLYALDQYEKRALYNFLFIFDNKNKFYCTDLVSRAYQSVLLDKNKQRDFSRSLNDDLFITTVNDLILSKDTYLTFYVEVIDGIPNIYYLENI